MKKFLFIGVITAFLISCPGSDPEIVTIQWEEDTDGYIQFSTNDKQFYNYSFWYWSGYYEETMTTVEVTLKKISGNPDYGQGIIFCHDSNTQSFYRLIITTNGYYNIVERYYENWYLIQDWSYSASIHTGYNVENKIRIVYTGSNISNVYFNNDFIINFYHSRRTGGYSGFYVSIGDEEYENFPYDPVDVRFKKLQPDLMPARSAGNTFNYSHRENYPDFCLQPR